MGFWQDIADDWFGQDPGPSQAQGLNEWQIQYLQQQQAQQAADAAAAQAAAEQAAAAQAAAAAQQPQQQPQQPQQPQGSVFDPTPFRSQVDTAFGQFTPEFYAQKYADFYNPYKSNVEGQYGLAKDQLTGGLAKRGLTNSTQGRGLFQQLDALRDQSFNQGQQGAQGFQSSLSDQANTAKNTLYGSIGEGADNTSIGSRAATEAGRIAGTQAPINSLGNIFGALVGPYADTQSPGGPVNPEQQAFATGDKLNLANVGSPSTKVVATKKKKF